MKITGISLCIVFFACFCTVGCSNSDTAAERSAKTHPIDPKPINITPPPELFVVLAQALAGDYQHSENDALPAPGSAEKIAELRQIRLNIARLATDEADVELLAKDSSKAIEEMIAAIDRVESLPSPPGWLQTFAGTAMYYYRGVINEDVSLEQIRVPDVTGGHAELHDAAMHALLKSSRRLTASRLLLPDIAKRFAGPNTASNTPILEVDFDDHHLNGADRISLRNISGFGLTNCTVFLQLNGKDGQVARNVHFIDKWEPGDSIFSMYLPGIQFRGKTYNRRTVDELQTIRISVYCDQLTSEDTVFTYTAADRRKDRVKLLKSLDFYGKYQQFDESYIALLSTPREVSVRFTGTQELRDVKLTLTLSNGANTASRTHEIGVWKEDTFHSIKFPAIDWEAEAYEATIELTKSGAKRTVVWTRE